MKNHFCIISLLLLAGPALGQDTILDRLRQIEANNQALSTRIGTVEAKVDALTVKVDRLAPSVQVQAQPVYSAPNCSVYGQCSPNAYFQAQAWPQASFEASGGCEPRQGLLARIRARRGR